MWVHLPKRSTVNVNQNTTLFNDTAELYSPRTCCPDRYSHSTSCFSLHPSEDTAQTQKEDLYAFSTAKLVNVKRFTAEQLSNATWPKSPSWPNHCGQLSSNWPLARSPVLLPAPHRAAQPGGPGEWTRLLRMGSCCEPKSEKTQGSPATIHHLRINLQDRVWRERDG